MFALLVAPLKSEVVGHWLEMLTRAFTPPPWAAATKFADCAAVMFVSAQFRLPSLMGATFQWMTWVNDENGIWLGVMLPSMLGKYPELQYEGAVVCAAATKALTNNSANVSSFRDFIPVNLAFEFADLLRRP
jgi:hypothetical protein